MPMPTTLTVCLNKSHGRIEYNSFVVFAILSYSFSQLIAKLSKNPLNLLQFRLSHSFMYMLKKGLL